MITVQETTERTLATSEEIAAYLEQGYDQMIGAAPFTFGKLVNINSRAGISPDVGIGDVAVFLVAVTGTPWSSVLLLTSGGARIVTQVPTENLAKRELAPTAESDQPA